jgi:hypothetical protein
MDQDKDRKPAEDEAEDTEGNVFVGGGPTTDREPSPTGDETGRDKAEDPREGIIPKRIIPKR